MESVHRIGGKILFLEFLVANSGCHFVGYFVILLSLVFSDCQNP